MKKLIGLVTALALSTPVAAEYLQLSSSISFDGRSSVLYDQIDAQDGIGYSQATGIEILKDGAYVIVFAPQTKVAKGCTSGWLRVNGEDVANSNVVYCTQSPKDTNVVVSQGVIPLQSGDVVTTEIDGEGVEAQFPTNAPQIPSAITSIWKLN